MWLQCLEMRGLISFTLTSHFVRGEPREQEERSPGPKRAGNQNAATRFHQANSFINDGETTQKTEGWKGPHRDF